MNSEAIMARTIEQEMQALEEEERRLAEKREQLAKRARDEAIKSVEKTGLLKLDGKRLEGSYDVGVQETERAEVHASHAKAAPTERPADATPAKPAAAAPIDPRRAIRLERR